MTPSERRAMEKKVEEYFVFALHHDPNKTTHDAFHRLMWTYQDWQEAERGQMVEVQPGITILKRDGAREKESKSLYLAAMQEAYEAMDISLAIIHTILDRPVDNVRTCECELPDIPCRYCFEQAPAYAEGQWNQDTRW